MWYWRVTLNSPIRPVIKNHAAPGNGTAEMLVIVTRLLDCTEPPAKCSTSCTNSPPRLKITTPLSCTVTTRKAIDLNQICSRISTTSCLLSDTGISSRTPLTGTLAPIQLPGALPTSPSNSVIMSTSIIVSTLSGDAAECGYLRPN